MNLSYEFKLKTDNESLLKKYPKFAQLPIEKMKEISRKSRFTNRKYDMTSIEMIHIRNIIHSRSALKEFFSHFSEEELTLAQEKLRRIFSNVNTDYYSHADIINKTLTSLQSFNRELLSSNDQIFESNDYHLIGYYEINEAIEYRKQEIAKEKSQEEGKSQGYQKVYPDKRKTFLDNIRKGTNKNLSKEQLREKYAKDLGIDSSVLNLPEVKKWLLMHPIFGMIDDIESYKSEKEKLENSQLLQIRKDKNTNTLQIIYTVPYLRNQKSFINITQGDEGTNITAMEPNEGYSDMESRFFNSEGIEYRRVIESRISGQVVPRILCFSRKKRN